MAITAIAVGAVVVGGIVQYMNSQEAMRMSQAEREKMIKLLQDVKSPDFDTRGISPEQYQILQKYVPQVSAYVEEKAPQLIKGDSKDALAGREAQLNALERFKNLSQTGTDQYSNILNEEALRAAQIQNHAQQQALLQDMQRRGGSAGSGLLFASQLGAQQAANQTATDSVRDAAKQAYLMRIEALKNSADIGGQVRNQELDMETRNTNAINDFNQRNASSRRDYNQNYDNSVNTANQYNIERAQQAADKNEAARYAEAVRRQTTANNSALNRAQFDYQKAGGQAGQMQGYINDAQNAAAQKNQAIGGVTSGIAGVAGNYKSSDDNYVYDKNGNRKPK